MHSHDIKLPIVFKGLLKKIIPLIYVYRRVNTIRDWHNRVLIAHTYDDMYYRADRARIIGDSAGES